MSVVEAEPTLFPDLEPRPVLDARSLEDLVLATLAAPDELGCPVCGGLLRPIAGGSTCAECGSSLLRGLDIGSPGGAGAGGAGAAR